MDIFSGKGVKIRLGEEEDFLKIKETLTRIGVASRKDKILIQSCMILHKQGEYAIVHFKELFSLDGKPSTLTEEDIGRRNLIAKLLQDWGLLKIEDMDKIENNISPISTIKIVKSAEKSEWKLESKYTIGKK